VGVATVKTGLSGAAGNKGAVAIRFLVHGTSMCFICGHLAAGHSNVKDRNQDFADISRRLAFARGYTVDCHDYVFWCGDFNYRIDMPLNDVKDLAKDENWKILQAYDQLNVERKKGAVFQGFIEGPTNFAPTYKYDLFSDDYDTSEKLRTPAWTDRVLWKRDQRSHQTATGQVGEDVAQIAAAAVKRSKAAESGETEGRIEGIGNNKQELNEKQKDVQGASWSPGRLLYYNRAELKTSDHRPVIAIFDIDIEQVNVDERKLVSEEVRLMMGPPDPTIIIKGQKDSCDDDLSALDPVLLVTAFQSFGEVLMIRLLEGKIYITFQDARSAVAALELDKKEVEGVILSVKLKCPWSPVTSANASLVPPHSPSPDHHMPSHLTVITSEHVQKIGSSPHSSPLQSPAQSPSSSPLLSRKRSRTKASPLTDAMDDALGKPESTESNDLETSTSLTEFLSDDEPSLSFDKKNETAEDILKEVEAELSRGSDELDGEMSELDRIIAEGRKAMAECTARASAKEKKKPSRPSRPPQPKPYSTSAIESSDASTVSSRPTRPTQLTSSPVKEETKLGKVAISQSPNSTRPGSAKSSPYVNPVKSSPGKPIKPSRWDMPSPVGKTDAQKPPIPARGSSFTFGVNRQKEEIINAGDRSSGSENKTNGDIVKSSVATELRKLPTKPKPYRPPPPKPERLPAVLRSVPFEPKQENETNTVAVEANDNKQPIRTTDFVDLTQNNVNRLAVDADDKAYKEASAGALSDSVFLEDVSDDQGQTVSAAEIARQNENQFDGKTVEIDEHKQTDFIQNNELQEVKREEILSGHSGDAADEVFAHSSPVARDGYKQQEEDKSDETPVKQKLPLPERPQPPIRTKSLDATRQQQQMTPKGNTNTPNPSERKVPPPPKPKPRPQVADRPRPPRPPTFSAKK
jgi:hypothetical protein